MGSGDREDLTLKHSPGREAGTLGSLAVGASQSRTSSLDQKHSTDGGHHGQGDGGQDREQDPGESVCPVHPLAGVKPWRARAWLLPGPRVGPKSVLLLISSFGSCLPASPLTAPPLAYIPRPGSWL